MNKRHSWEKRIEQLQNEKNMTPKQAKILQAAIELFARKGYFNTSTNEIAKLAGVAEGTIFRHYQTKKELLEAILAPAIMDFTATFFVDQFIADAIHTSHKNMREFLEAFTRNRFEFARQNTPAVRILLQELAFHPDMQETIKQLFMKKIYPRLTKVLVHFQSQGELKDIEMPAIIRMMISPILGLVINRFIIQPHAEHDDEKEIRQTVDFIMNGLGK